MKTVVTLIAFGALLIGVGVLSEKYTPFVVIFGLLLLLGAARLLLP